jgi:hypothetical protein
VINPYQFPRVVKLIEDCERFFHKLREEARAVPMVPWPEEINEGGWEVAGARWQGKDLELAPPALRQLIERHSDLIYNAGYSLLDPGAVIAPHVGYTDHVFRFHFGLEVPKGDCQISIAGFHFRWFVAEPLLFDDTFRHEAWNKTQFQRIVLLADLRRDVLEPNTGTPRE